MFGCARVLPQKVLRLYPPPSRELSAGATMYEDLEVLPLERRNASRPYEIVNMVSSLEGKTAIEGRSSRLGSDIDRQSVRTLRSKVGGVMVSSLEGRSTEVRPFFVTIGHRRPTVSKRPCTATNIPRWRRRPSKWQAMTCRTSLTFARTPYVWPRPRLTALLGIFIYT